MRDARLPEVALVTGAASGIGLAVAAALSRAGTRVAMLDRDADGLSRAAEQLRAEQETATMTCALDVRDGDAIRDAVERAERELGPIDGVASVAGVLHMGAAVDAGDGSAALDPHAFDETLAVNAGGPFLLAQAVVPGMVARRRGAWVTVASNAARTPRVGMAAYAASKAAAVMFTRCLGLEVARHGVRCNVVSPGSTDTPMQQAFWKNGAGGPEGVIAGDLERYRLGIPLGRIASPEDVAESVLYLLSDRARHVTLQELCVDGGATF